MMQNKEVNSIVSSIVLAEQIYQDMIDDEPVEGFLQFILDKQAVGVDILATLIELSDSKVKFLQEQIKQLQDYKTHISSRVEWLKHSAVEAHESGQIPKKLMGNTKSVSVVNNSQPKIDWLGNEDDLHLLYLDHPSLVNKKVVTTYSLNKEAVLALEEEHPLIVVTKGKHIRTGNAPVVV
jgi:hypothetical protein